MKRYLCVLVWIILRIYHTDVVVNTICLSVCLCFVSLMQSSNWITSPIPSFLGNGDCKGLITNRKKTEIDRQWSHYHDIYYKMKLMILRTLEKLQLRLILTSTVITLPDFLYQTSITHPNHWVCHALPLNGTSIWQQHLCMSGTWLAVLSTLLALAESCLLLWCGQIPCTSDDYVRRLLLLR